MTEPVVAAGYWVLLCRLFCWGITALKSAKGNTRVPFHPELFPVSSSASGQRLTGGEDSVAMWIKSVVRGGFESQSFAKTVVFVLFLTLS